MTTPNANNKRLVAAGSVTRAGIHLDVDPTFGSDEEWLRAITTAVAVGGAQDMCTVETLAELDAFDGVYNPPLCAAAGEYSRYINAWLSARTRMAQEAEDTEDYASWLVDEEWIRRGC